MSKAGKHDNKWIKDSILGNEEQYRDMLLAAAMRIECVWEKVEPWLCVKVTQSGETVAVNELGTPSLYAFYLTLKLFREGRKGFIVPSRDAFELHYGIGASSKYAQAFHTVSVDDVMEEYDMLVDMLTDKDLEFYVSDTCLKWIRNTKLKSDATDIMLNGSGDRDAVELIDEIRSNIAAIEDSDETEESEFHHMGDGDDEEEVERIPLGAPFIDFNIALGGGLGKKEHILVCAPTGQGKTVFALQLAAHVAAGGPRHVLFISTEQNHTELEPRIISCQSCDTSAGMTPISFDEIKDGVNKTLANRTLNDDQVNTVKAIQASLRPFLHMVDWKGGQKSINDLQALVQKAKKVYGQVDVVILDWIGAALGEGVTDSDKKRNLYYLAAEKMKNIAAEENVATISMAQTTKDGFNKPMITEEHLAECKSLHWQATAAFGISALRDKLNEGSESQGTYKDVQWMNAFKSRKSKSIIFKIQRDFDHQRFSKL